MRSRRNRIARLVVFLLIGVPIFILVFGGAVLYLWNWLMPGLFGLRTITFWQAFGLFILCRFLFGGFGMGAHRRSMWSHRMRERFHHMTPAEREAFFRGAFGIDDLPKGSAPGTAS